MRAIICREFNGPAGLTCEEVGPPKLEPGSVRIAVEAAGVNFADTLIVAGRYQVKPALPFTPGFEVAGTVAEVASDVTGLRPGERVMAIPGVGGFAEEVVCPARVVFKIPKELDFASAAALPIAYGTVHGALGHRGALKAGETLLVLGAAGGAGLAAVEIGKAMGARVIAAARGPDKIARTLAHGADLAIDYAAEDLRERIKDLTDGRGVDVIFDPVGGDACDAGLRCLAWEGRILIVGFASGRIPAIPANLLLVKNVSAIGVFWGEYRHRRPDLVRAAFAEILGWWRDGRVKPHVSARLPLERAADALDLLASRRSMGKVVLTVTEV